METLIIKVKSERAKKLIKDLEDLDILEVVASSPAYKNAAPTNISDLKKKIATPMNEVAINEQLEKIRNEWQPNT